MQATQSQLNGERFRARELESSFNSQHQKLIDELKYLRQCVDDCERLHRSRHSNHENPVPRDGKSGRNEMMIPERDSQQGSKLTSKDQVEKGMLNLKPLVDIRQLIN